MEDKKAGLPVEIQESTKSQIPISKQVPNSKIPNPKRYDLEDRCLEFAKRVKEYINALPKSLTNIEFSRQLIRSAGSVGANYIEANESLSRKDFLLRAKTARKEAKESAYWIRLTDAAREWVVEKDALIQESEELLRILSAIIVRFRA